MEIVDGEKLKRAKALKSTLVKQQRAVLEAEAAAERAKEAQKAARQAKIDAQKELGRLRRQQDTLKRIAGRVPESRSSRTRHAVKAFFDIVLMCCGGDNELIKDYKSLQDTELVAKALRGAMVEKSDEKGQLMRIEINITQFRSNIANETQRYKNDINEAKEILGMDALDFFQATSTKPDEKPVERSLESSANTTDGGQ